MEIINNFTSVNGWLRLYNSEVPNISYNKL